MTAHDLFNLLLEWLLVTRRASGPFVLKAESTGKERLQKVPIWIRFQSRGTFQQRSCAVKNGMRSTVFELLNRLLALTFCVCGCVCLLDFKYCVIQLCTTSKWTRSRSMRTVRFLSRHVLCRSTYEIHALVLFKSKKLLAGSGRRNIPKLVGGLVAIFLAFSH